MPSAAIFIDRDDTLVRNVPYLADPAQLVLLPGATAGLRRLHDLGYPLILITNQSGIGRGYLTEATLQLVHARLVALLAAEGVALTAIYHCPHAPTTACACRKPRPGMLHAAARDHGYDLARSWMIGDNETDMLAGQAAGCRTIRLAPAPVSTVAEVVVADLLAAAHYVAQHAPPVC